MNSKQQATMTLGTQFAPVTGDMDVEAYLFCPANLPHAFISLTSNPDDEHHSPPTTPTTECHPKSILKNVAVSQRQQKKATVDFKPIPSPVQHSTASPTSSSEEEEQHPDLEDGFLGGGALRHVAASHHLRDLAMSHPAQARMPSTANTRVQQVKKVGTVQKVGQPEHGEGWHVMDWWPVPVEVMEHEWTDAFYE